MAPSRTTPRTVPKMLPFPPVMAAPPTTTAAMTFISSPKPVLLGIWLNRTELSVAARPVKTPERANTEYVTKLVLMPASRAASEFDPVAYMKRPAARRRNAQAIATARIADAENATAEYADCGKPNHWKPEGRS